MAEWLNFNQVRSVLYWKFFPSRTKQHTNTKTIMLRTWTLVWWVCVLSTASERHAITTRAANVSELFCILLIQHPAELKIRRGFSISQSFVSRFAGEWQGCKLHEGSRKAFAAKRASELVSSLFKKLNEGGWWFIVLMLRLIMIYVKKLQMIQSIFPTHPTQGVDEK